MKGKLDFDGSKWFVRYVDETGEIIKYVSVDLHPNPCLHVFHKLEVDKEVEFELVRHCQIHKCDISIKSPCSIDCAWDEITYVKLVETSDNKCTHMYSKAMNQPYPRICVKCGAPEREYIPVSCAFCGNTIDLAAEDTCSRCGKSHFEDPLPYEIMAELLEKTFSLFSNKEFNEIKMRNEYGRERGNAFKIWCYDHPDFVYKFIHYLNPKENKK